MSGQPTTSVRKANHPSQFQKKKTSKKIKKCLTTKYGYDTITLWLREMK